MQNQDRADEKEPDTIKTNRDLIESAFTDPAKHRAQSQRLAEELHKLINPEKKGTTK